MTPNRDDLLFLKALVESGKARPVIERRYPLSDIAEALRHVGEGRAQGQTVIRVTAGAPLSESDSSLPTGTVGSHPRHRR